MATNNTQWITYFLLLVSIFSNYSQQAPSKGYLKKGSSISLNLLGTASIAGITYDRIVSETVSYEVGLGVAGIGAGISYYPKKMNYNQYCPYVGLKVNSIALVDVGKAYGGYIPFGCTYFTASKFNIGFDLGPAYARIHQIDSDFLNTTQNRWLLFGNLKVGIRL